ncbi:MAG: Crp/Fnr family transcriptional regulator [Bacteroidia bacterium]
MPYLKYFQTFSPVEEGVIADFLAEGRVVAYKKGEMITQEGQVQRDLLLVKDGVQMSFFNHEGAIQVMAFTYSPSVSGIPESFLFQTPSKYALQALTDSQLWAISYEKWKTHLDKSHALERLFRKMAEHFLVGMINRHIELETLTIEQRFRQFANRSGHLFQIVPHKYLASYLNMNPTNFSKLFNSVKL